MWRRETRGNGKKNEWIWGTSILFDVGIFLGDCYRPLLISINSEPTNRRVKNRDARLDQRNERGATLGAAVFALDLIFDLRSGRHCSAL